MTATPLEVVCPRCGGRAAIDPQYSALPAWACPFCAAVNPTPKPPPARDLLPKPRDRERAAAIAAVGVLAVIVVVSLSLQATHPRPPPRTVAGVAEALARAGLPCSALRTVPATPPARETGTCILAGRPITILTFVARGRRDRWVRDLPRGEHAVGETWIVRAPDERTAAAVARALGGHTIRKE